MKSKQLLSFIRVDAGGDIRIMRWQSTTRQKGNETRNDNGIK